MSCNVDSPIKRLLFRVPSKEFITEEFKLNENYVVQSNFSDNFYFYLKVPVNAAEYTRIVEGEKPRYSDTWSQTYYSPRLARVGFRVGTSFSDVKLFACLDYLGKISASTSYNTYTAIQVIDYVRPESEDVRIGLINNTEPYTIRYGMLNIDEGTGYFGYSNETRTHLYTDNGFGFTFTEYNKRMII